jgi:hypothetical protein
LQGAAGLDQEMGGLDNLILDVLLDPFLFGKGLVANCIVSIDVCSLIHPQPSTPDALPAAAGSFI